MRNVLVLLVVFTVGCASLAVNRSSVHSRPESGLGVDGCLRLMDRRDGAQFAGKILAGVGGASALGAAPEEFPPEVRWSIATGAVLAAAVGVGVLWLGDRYAEEFEAYCEAEFEISNGTDPEPSKATQSEISNGTDPEPSKATQSEISNGTDPERRIEL